MTLSRTSWAAITAILAVYSQGSFGSEDSETTGSRGYYLIPGTRITYITSATLQTRGDFERKEAALIRSTFTVMDQRTEGRTMLAEVDKLSSVEASTSAAAEVKARPVARFTLVLPTEGATPGQTVQTAGLAGSPFPGWKFESLFPPVSPDGKSTATVTLDVVNEILESNQEIRASEKNTRIEQRQAQSNPQGVQQYGYEAEFSSTDSSVVSTSQSVVAAVSAGSGTHAILTLSYQSNRTALSKLGAQELAQLKKDVETAIPLSTRLRSLSVSGDESVKQALSGMDEYLKTFPSGSFASLYKDIRERLSTLTALRENSKKIQEGNSAPDFDVTAIDGQKIKLSSYKGKVVLLDFWATWCGPCVSLIPEVKRVYEANKDKPFVLLGISADHELSALKNFVQKQELKWPQVFEPESDPGTAQLAYGITKYPTTVLIDAQGQIRKIDAHGDELSSAIDELTAQVK